jgi:hypothetical protein
MIHTHTHTHTHTFLYTYIHTYIQTCIHTYIYHEYASYASSVRLLAYDALSYLYEALSYETGLGYVDMLETGNEMLQVFNIEC